MTIYNYLQKIFQDFDFGISTYDNFDDDDDKEQYNINDINLESIGMDELLYLANMYCSTRSGYIFKTKQIKTYDWMTEEHMNECMKRLEKLGISEKAEFEKEIVIENKDETSNRKIIGYIDCVDGNNLYEFKCTTNLEKEYYLQLAVYMYLYEMNNQTINDVKIMDEICYNNKKGTIVKILKNGMIKVKNAMTNKIEKITRSEINKQMKYLLFNILTNQMIQVSCSIDKLKEMIKYLIHKRYVNQNDMTDQEFLDKVNDIGKKINKIEKIQKKQEELKYMIIDIETCGEKDRNKIVQIAYFICDYKFNKLEERNIILRNSNNEVDYYQRLTQRDIIEKGVLPEIACKKFYNDLKKCDYIIGFNSNRFDIPICRRYFSEMCEVELTFPEPIDMMSLTRQIVMAKNKKGRLKSPSQTELYHYLFNENEIDIKKHTANYDVYILWRCCKKLYDDKQLDIINNKIVFKQLFESDNIDDLSEFEMSEHIYEQVKDKKEIDIFIEEMDALILIYSKWKEKINDQERIKKLMRLTYLDWKNKTDFEETRNKLKSKYSDTDLKLVRDIFNICNDRRKTNQ